MSKKLNSTSKINSQIHMEPHYNQTIESQTQRILKAAKEKSCIYKGYLTRLVTDFSPETIKVRR